MKKLYLNPEDTYIDIHTNMNPMEQNETISAMVEAEDHNSIYNEKVLTEYKKFEEWLRSNNMIVDTFAKDEKYALYKEDAYFIRNLRNLVAHNGPNYVEVKEDAITRIEKFVDKITTDSLEHLMFPIEGILTAKMSDRVLPYLQKLQQLDYSYLPIVNEKDVCLDVFSADVLMCYTCLGKSVNATTTFGDIYKELQNTRLERVYDYLPIKSSVIDVINTFKVTASFHLDVVLVTEDGHSDSPLLGMITIWDLQ